MNPTTVVLFGTFDGLHDGHRAYITEARAHGERVVVIVARDSAVEKLKGKAPLYSEADRIHALLDVPEVDLVLLGDEEEGTYRALKEVHPQVVLLGYDQQSLFDSLTKAIESGIVPPVEMIYGSAYKPESMHSSILNIPHGNS